MRAARREEIPVGRAAGLQGGDMVDDRGGDVVSQSRLSHDDSKQRAVDTLQMPDQIGFNLIADQPEQTARCVTLRSKRAAWL